MRRRFTVEEKEAWVRLYQEGLTIQDISNFYNNSPTWNTVSIALYEAGIFPRKLIDEGQRRGRKGGYRRFCFEEEEKIIAVYQELCSLALTAIRFQCGKDVIKRILKRHKIASHPRGNSPRNFTVEQKNKIIEQWRSGVSQAAIASQLKVNQTTISGFLSCKGETKETRQAKGSRHGNWKGGRSISKYVFVLLSPDHPLRIMADNSRYVLEHRLVMGEALGRPLFPYETVHHIDGNCQNNRLENLQLRIGKHGKGITHRCRSCGSVDIEPILLE